MAGTHKLEQKVIHEILPLEVFVKVLKKLGYKNIRTAKGTCKKWVQVIQGFRIVEAILSKLPIQMSYRSFNMTIFQLFDHNYFLR